MLNRNSLHSAHYDTYLIVFCGDFGLNTAEAEPVDMRLPPSRQPIREFGDRGVLDAEARTGSGGKAGGEDQVLGASTPECVNRIRQY